MILLPVSVKGGHNLSNLKQAFQDRGDDLAKCLTNGSVYPGEEIFPGVYRMEYRVPLRNSDGSLMIPNQLGRVQVKTVYDPAVISDAEMLQWARQAMRDPSPHPSDLRRFTGTAENGLRFEGWLDNGQWISVYPV